MSKKEWLWPPFFFMPFRGVYLRSRSFLTPTAPSRYSLFIDLHLLKRTQAAEQLMRYTLSPIAKSPGSLPPLIVNPYDTPSLMPGGYGCTVALRHLGWCVFFRLRQAEPCRLFLRTRRLYSLHPFKVCPVAFVLW